jgi:exosortase H (IPTLxxWG-CTERM-specific)
MARFGLVFFAVLLACFAAELTPPVQRALVEPWTALVARASTSTMKAFDPAVIVNGATIASRDSEFSVTILAGCNGIEAMIVLVAAIVAFPATWKQRLAGLAAGVAAIQALNVVRIVSLFYLGQWNLAAFEWAHLYVWQVLIMLDALVVFLLWLRSLPRIPLSADGVTS